MYSIGQASGVPNSPTTSAVHTGRQRVGRRSKHGNIPFVLLKDPPPPLKEQG